MHQQNPTAIGILSIRSGNPQQMTIPAQRRYPTRHPAGWGHGIDRLFQAGAFAGVSRPVAHPIPDLPEHPLTGHFIGGR